MESGSTLSFDRSLAMRRLAVLAAVLALAACQKPATAVSDDDMTLGSATAPVTVIEYASLACPHCAAFNNDVFPTVKTKYIDTGKVRWVAREALTADPALAAAGFLTARCAGKDKYFQVTDAIYHIPAYHEEGDTTAFDAHAALLAIARGAGMTDAKFEACVRDQGARKALEDRVSNYKIESTPTFVINGKTYAKGELSLAEMDQAIAEAQSGKPAS
jgi:protein-disulfide isomerase